MPIEAVTGFDEHAVFYTARPELWTGLPIHTRARAASPPTDAEGGTWPDQLAGLVKSLDAAGVRLAYRELTTVDVAQAGIRVARVQSPDLTPIHHDHRWPFLGGRSPDLGFRFPYANAPAGSFPSPHPHALG